MDILKEITEQINSINQIDNSIYLDKVLTHLDRADLYYRQGNKDNNYYNDVIYRGNQAYEGALKESYKILAGKPESEVFRETPDNIEKFFSENNIFRARVLQLFKNYRKEWRNKSTHDYKLFFDESEAFLALVSVSSFVHLLLKQIQEKLAYNKQEKKLNEEDSQIKEINSIAKSDADPLEKLIHLITLFSETNKSYNHPPTSLKEEEIIGILHAYLSNATGLKVKREPFIETNNVIIRPDFLITVENTPIVLEIKRHMVAQSDTNNMVNQITSYMQISKAHHGIVYLTNPVKPKSKVEVLRFHKNIDSENYELALISD